MSRLESQNKLRCEFSALLVDELACAGPKMATRSGSQYRAAPTISVFGSSPEFPMPPGGGRFEAEIMLLHVVGMGEHNLAEDPLPRRQAQLDAFLADELKYFTTQRLCVAGARSYDYPRQGRDKFARRPFVQGQ